MTTTERAGSWRDPSGFVWLSGGRILRAVVPEMVDALRELLDAPWYQARVAAGVVPGTRWLAENAALPNHPQAEQFVWLEHEALGFPCYPHEFTALQLYDAAKLTLSLAIEALEQGWVLKDASAWNVLFDNGKPVFATFFLLRGCDLKTRLAFGPLMPSIAGTF